MCLCSNNASNNARYFMSSIKVPNGGRTLALAGIYSILIQTPHFLSENTNRVVHKLPVTQLTSEGSGLREPGSLTP